MKVLRSLVFYAGYFLALLISGLVLLPVAPFLSLFSRFRVLNLYNRFIVGWFAVSCGVRYHVSGRDNVCAFKI